MTDAALLEYVKNCLPVTGNFFDKLLSNYIEEVKSFMSDAGVKENILESEASYGCITRGVSDLWNHGETKGELSNYFKMRVIQLAAKSKKEAE